MKILSFLLDICPFIGGVKMVLEAAIKKDMVGNRLEGRLRGIHFFIGVATFIFDMFTVEGGGITRGLFKLFGEGFIKRAAVAGAERAGAGTATRTILTKTASTISRVEETKIGKKAIEVIEKRIQKKVKESTKEIEDYRKDAEKREEIRRKYASMTDDMRRRIIEEQRRRKNKNTIENEEEVLNIDTDLDYISIQQNNKPKNKIFNISRQILGRGQLKQKPTQRDIIIAQQKQRKLQSNEASLQKK